MIEFKKLAIAAAIGSAVLGASVAEAHVSYNKSATVNNNLLGPWTGGAPAGYTGKLPATWVANVHNDLDPNASYEVSTADALAEGADAAYVVETLNNKWAPANSWGNALDFGLIDLKAAGNLTIRVEDDLSLGSTFLPGFTLWQNWDNTTTSSKHGSWNANPFAPGNRGATNLVYLGHASTSSSDGGINYSYDNGSSHAVEITFQNLAAGHYSLWIGGNGSGNTSVGQQYIATITAAPVPVPGAVWLFGSAMAGLVGFGRRKKVLSA